MIRRLALLVLLAAAIGLKVSAPARAHALDPGYLDLQRLSETDWRVLWRKPQVQGRPMAIEAMLPDSCDPRSGPSPDFDGRAFVARWVASCEGGLSGGTIRIEGLEATRTDVLVRYQAGPDPPAQTWRLTAQETSFVVPEGPGRFDVARNYFGLGVDHILEGIDHLLFVFTLLLLVGGPWRVIGTVTAFTIAHSLTLGAATLGLLVVAPPVVETLIALSIATLAVELVRSPGAGPEPGPGLSERFPWIVAFAFGLLHGLGFARALLDIGLPDTDVVIALFAFNVGVEAGQLVFVAVVVLAGWIAMAIQPGAISIMSVGRPGRIASGYVIGTVAAFWTVERLTALLAQPPLT